jgi:hypothetical protein
MVNEFPGGGSRMASDGQAVPAPVAPVFVLCLGRSGSTLLRFVLDAHPALACPPETNMGQLFAQLAVVWSLVEGAPLSANRGDTPPVVPEAAVTGIRHTADMIIGSYLARRGKRRFCDKSLGTARYAELMLRVYPDAKFVCLYRHPMDVISSALGACPWGLSGYGFDPYIVTSPGNSVGALAAYWLDQTSMIAKFEENHTDCCHRVRYEDLVEAPELVAREVFDFLGVPHVPGIGNRCLRERAEPFGPGDHKIWATSAITTGSVGSGQCVPAGVIPPPLAEGINALLARLDYVQIDSQWGTPGQPSDPRLPGTAGESAPTGQPAVPANKTQLLERRLRTAVAASDDGFAGRWPSCATESVLIVARLPRSAGHVGEAFWVADLAAHTVEPRAADPDEGGNVDWSIVGPIDAWLAVMAGEVNLSGAIRCWQLRYCDLNDGDQFAAQSRISMLADLLNLASAHEPEAEQQVPSVTAFATAGI